MSDVLLTSLLEDKRSFFQVSLTRELLSWVRVTAPDGAGNGSGGWGKAQRLKQRESILSSSPCSVATDVNSRRSALVRHVLGVSTSEFPTSRWAKQQSQPSKTKMSSATTAAESSQSSTGNSFSNSFMSSGNPDGMGSVNASIVSAATTVHASVVSPAKASVDASVSSDPNCQLDSHLLNNSPKLTSRRADHLVPGGMAHGAPSSHSALHFHVHVAKPTSNRKWRYATYSFSCLDSVTCLRWVNAIRDILDKIDENRPRRLLVLVNPYGGKGRGPKIFRRHVKPIFDMALIKSTVIETQYRGHGADIVSHVDLSSVDGVVAVGGDGTFNEIANALIRRVNAQEKVDVDDPEACLKSLTTRVGIIPCGSTDCIAFSTMGINDAISCSIHTVLGKSLSLDVASVHHNRQLVRYSLTFMGYGYYGDVLLNSEKYRALGPGRYNLAGFKKLVSFGSYEGEVSFLPSDSPSHPGDGNICYSDCKICFKDNSTTTATKSGDARSLSSSCPISSSTGDANAASIASDSAYASNASSSVSPADSVGGGVEGIANATKTNDVRGEEERQLKDGAPEDGGKDRDLNAGLGVEYNARSEGEVNAGFAAESLGETSTKATTTSTATAILKTTTTTTTAPKATTGTTSNPAQRPTSMMGLPLKQKTLPPLKSDLDSSPTSDTGRSQWISIQGKFIGVNCIMMSARCGLCPDGLSPFGHLGDGCMDLMLASECSRLTYLRHLIKCARPNVNQLKFGFIDIFRVKAFKFVPKRVERIADNNGRSWGRKPCRACGETTSTPQLSSCPCPLTPSSPYSLPSSPEAEIGTADHLNLIPVEEGPQTPSPGCAGCMAMPNSDGGNIREVEEGRPLKKSVWNCDGETILDTAVEVKMHRQVIHMFGSGIPDPHDSEAVTPGCEESQSDCYDFSN